MEATDSIFVVQESEIIFVIKVAEELTQVMEERRCFAGSDS